MGKIPDKLIQNIVDKLHGNADIWETEDAKKPNKYGCFEKTTQHIIFQFPVDVENHSMSEYQPLWDDWKSVIKPLIRRATKPYNYAKGKTARIMLAKLLAGKSIGMHVDTFQSADVPHKIHVPLITNPTVKFFASSEKFVGGFRYG